MTTPTCLIPATITKMRNAFSSRSLRKAATRRRCLRAGRTGRRTNSLSLPSGEPTDTSLDLKSAQIGGVLVAGAISDGERLYKTEGSLLSSDRRSRDHRQQSRCPHRPRLTCPKKVLFFSPEGQPLHQAAFVLETLGQRKSAHIQAMVKMHGMRLCGSRRNVKHQKSTPAQQ
jgi:hypothetical protein